MFPSFRCWLAALRLSIPNYLGFAAFTFMFWCIAIAGVAIAAASGDWKILPICIAMAASALLIGILFYMLLSLLWFGVLKLLWSKPPIAIAPNWVQMPLNFAISLIAALPIAIIFTGRISKVAAIETLYNVETYLPDNYVVDLIFRFYWLWLLVAAYSYHFVAKCFKPTENKAIKTKLN
ncbi:hypothetical protein P7L53_00450 [Thermoleptolyngbya sichuanensis XZ-Cy5]|uniref:hypothetical protein n=1 Tax=Thermoleptolyngbya sichuanensis TaxID=2885951 RepID=UPI00240E629B|nr:hypothetical protein [Thermoleptolyngbya sichuanensis]MDG2614701.1 hypothetical protein [Thermoleptolyngbya sichuanensis XZ-Cy5]